MWFFAQVLIMGGAVTLLIWASIARSRLNCQMRPLTPPHSPDDGCKQRKCAENG
ncbi:predicted protein [Brucella sp. NVSL 07-0026]|nr:predicted protein [Brucella sp. NVSL 07-0026]